MDYLMEEVLKRQTPEIKDLLFITALLEFFSGELCDAVVHTRTGIFVLLILILYFFGYKIVKFLDKLPDRV